MRDESASSDDVRMDRGRALRARLLFWWIPNERRRWRARAAYALPECLRLVYRLKHRGGLDSAAIAAQLGVDRQEVLRQMARAMFLITMSIGEQERAALRWRTRWSFGRRREE